MRIIKFTDSILVRYENFAALEIIETSIKRIVIYLTSGERIFPLEWEFVDIREAQKKLEEIRIKLTEEEKWNGKQ